MRNPICTACGRRITGNSGQLVLHVSWLVERWETIHDECKRRRALEWERLARTRGFCGSEGTCEYTIDVADFRDPVERADWQRHLCGKSWWYGSDSLDEMFRASARRRKEE